MEYGIDNKSKYTTLQIRTTLDCKNKEWKTKKKTQTPKEDGERARKSLLKKYFLYYYLLQYQKTEISETSWSLYGMKLRSYNFAKCLNFTERGDPWGDLNAPKATFK